MSAHDFIVTKSSPIPRSAANGRLAFRLFFGAVIVVASLASAGANAQSISPDAQFSSGVKPYAQPGASVLPSPEPAPAYPKEEPSSMGENAIFWHVFFNQLEGRTNGPDNELRWDGEAWIGTDMNRLWFKSEGFVENGMASDGITEALYARPIPFLRYFDLQAGIRYDPDSNRGRTWGAIGIEGLAPDFLDRKSVV